MSIALDGSNDYLQDDSYTMPGAVFAHGMRYTTTTAAVRNTIIQVVAADYTGITCETNTSGEWVFAAEGDIDFFSSGATSIVQSTTAWNAIIHVFRATDDQELFCWNGTTEESVTITSDPGNIVPSRINLGALQEASDPAARFITGNIAEFFEMNREPTAGEITAYFKGVSPDLVWPANNIEYKRLIRNINGEKGDRGVITLVDGGSSGVAGHAPTIYPSRRSIFVPAAAVGGLSIPIAMHHYKQLMGAN